MFPAAIVAAGRLARRRPSTSRRTLSRLACPAMPIAESPARAGPRGRDPKTAGGLRAAARAHESHGGRVGHVHVAVEAVAGEVADDGARSSSSRRSSRSRHAEAGEGMGRATGVSAGISGGFAAGGRRRLRICGPGCLIVTIADGDTLAIHRTVRWTMRASSTAHVGCALALLLGGCSSPERREIPASPEAASAEEASPEDERCASFVDSFSICLLYTSRCV